MKQKLTGIAYYKAIIAKWIVVNIAYKISPLAVISLCLELSRLHQESIQVNEKED
jgi:hypothetical protein